MRWLAILLLTALPASAEQITCRSGSEQIILSLHDRVIAGTSFDCIRGSFLGRTNNPCAPNGAFSLYGPSGEFESITQQSNYLSHIGSVIGHFVDDKTITFTGGYGGPDGYRPIWRFTLDRAAATAQLVRPDRTPVEYFCDSV